MSWLPLASGLLLLGLNASHLSGQEVRLLPGPRISVPADARSVQFSADDRYLMVGDAGGNLTVADLEQGGELVFLRGVSQHPIRFASFLAQDSSIVVIDEGGGSGFLSFGLATQSSPVESGPRIPSRAPFLVLDSSRRFLAVAREDHDVEIVDLQTRRRHGQLRGRDDGGKVMHVGFDRGGRQLISLTARGNLTAWDPGTLEVLRRVQLQGDELQGSRTVVHAAGADRGANVLVLGLEEVALPRGAFRRDARPSDLERRHQLLVFDWFSGGRIRQTLLEEGPVEHLVVAPGSDHATVASGRRLFVHNLRSGEPVAGVQLPAVAVQLAVSPGGRWAAVALRGREVLTWEIQVSTVPVLAEREERPRGLSGRIRILGPDEPLVPASDSIVLAILPFDERDPEEADGMMRMIPDLLITQLANLPNLRVVERLRIQSLLDELTLQERGITEADGLRLGEMLNADYILLGSVGASGLTFTVSARLLQVATGEAVGGRQVICEECRGPEIFEAIYLLGETLAR